MIKDRVIHDDWYRLFGSGGNSYRNYKGVNQMAINIHVVSIGYFKVDSVGNVIDKDDPNITIQQHLNSSHENRVVPDDLVPNSTAYPTIKEFLEAEASDDFKLQYMDQNKIITYQI